MTVRGDRIHAQVQGSQIVPSDRACRSCALSVEVLLVQPIRVGCQHCGRTFLILARSRFSKRFAASHISL